MKQGQALFELQAVDLETMDHQQRLQAIQTQLDDNQAVQRAKAAVERAAAALAPWQRQLRDLELQTQTVQTKRQSTEQRLYSGSVTNPKELEDMQREIESLKGRQATLEEQSLELMMSIEAAQETLATAEQNLAETLAEVEEENVDLLMERRVIQSQLEKLAARREAIAAGLTAANLTTYDTMRPQKANRPIARLTPDNSCSACGIQQNNTVVNAIKQGSDLMTCLNCKRILVHF